MGAGTPALAQVTGCDQAGENPWVVQRWCSAQRAHPIQNTRIAQGAASAEKPFPSMVCSWCSTKNCTDHPVSLDMEKWIERKSFGVLAGNEGPDEGRFYTLESNSTSGCHLPWEWPRGFVLPCHSPQGENPGCLWDPLAVVTPKCPHCGEHREVPRLQLLPGALDLFSLCLRRLWVNLCNLLWGFQQRGELVVPLEKTSVAGSLQPCLGSLPTATGEGSWG